MKIHRFAALCLSLILLAGCAMRQADPQEAAPETDGAALPEPALSSAAEAEEIPEETEVPGVPADPEYVEMVRLELERDPVYADGTLILYFTDHEVWYEDDDAAMIGVISADSASSQTARIVTKDHPELLNGEDYLGAALIPEEPLAAGTYNFTVTVGRYLVSFSMTVE